MRTARTQAYRKARWILPLILVITTAINYHLQTVANLKSQIPLAQAYVAHIQEPTPSPTPTQTPTPTPTPKPKTAPKPNGEIQERVYALIGEIWGKDADLGRRIAYCESTYGTNVISKTSTARGTFQFLKGTWIDQRKHEGSNQDPDLRLNERENIQTAYNHYKRMGTSPWNASKHCWGK